MQLPNSLRTDHVATRTLNVPSHAYCYRKYTGYPETLDLSDYAALCKDGIVWGQLCSISQNGTIKYSTGWLI